MSTYLQISSVLIRYGTVCILKSDLIPAGTEELIHV